MPVYPWEKRRTGNFRGATAGAASSSACVRTSSSPSKTVSAAPRSFAKLRTSASPSRRYSASPRLRGADAGYQASTSTCRNSPDAVKVSRRELSVSRQAVVPTAYRPVGGGNSKAAGPTPRGVAALVSPRTTRIAAVVIAATRPRLIMSASIRPSAIVNPVQKISRLPLRVAGGQQIADNSHRGCASFDHRGSTFEGDATDGDKGQAPRPGTARRLADHREADRLKPGCLRRRAEYRSDRDVGDSAGR